MEIGHDHIMGRYEYHTEGMSLKTSEKENERMAWPDLSRAQSRSRYGIDWSVERAGIKTEKSVKNLLFQDLIRPQFSFWQLDWK